MAHRSILITGCSSGIGLAAAQRLRDSGWRVLGTARKPADLERLNREERIEALPLEMAEPASVAACAEQVLSLTGGVDALYNNAAYGLIGAMEDVSPELLQRQFQVNVIATHDLTRRMIPAMRARGGGRIVMCSSVLGLLSGPYRGSYCASKFALEAMSDALRLELAPAGIHVAIIEPGPVETEFMPSTIATFKASIDTEASPHKAYYERRLAEMQNGARRRLAAKPGAVVDKIVHALESPRPKVRYKVGMATHAAGLLKRGLSDRLLDRIMMRV